MNLERLIEIKDEIENLDKSCHLEVFNLLNNNNISYNSNMNGVFINLTELEENIIINLEKYIEYKKTQKQFLKKDEEIKEQYKKEFFN